MKVSFSGDGTRVAIGGHNNDDNGVNAGYVRVLEWNGTVWTQVGSDLDGPVVGGRFGGAVSLSNDGSRLIVGRRSIGAGAAYVYDWNGTAWVQVGSTLNGVSNNDQFGAAVAISPNGDRIAIGATNDGTTLTGQVDIYDWNGTAWVLVGVPIVGLGGDNLAEAFQFSDNGNRLVMGAPINNTPGTFTGVARVYEWNGAVWTQLGSDIYGDNNNDFLTDVSISGSGNRIAVGIPTLGGGNMSGYARVYDWNGTNWIQAGSDITGLNNEGNVGYAVYLSQDGNRLACSARSSFSSAGVVKIYDWSGTEWIQTHCTIRGVSGDVIGTDLSLSSDGMLLAIGAPTNGASKLGFVQVYELNDTSIDSDSDGVNDVVDLDDDNDGILDLNECTSIDYDGDRLENYLEADSDADGCPDVNEADYADSDLDTYLGTSPVTVDADGLVTGFGGYMGPVAVTVNGVPTSTTGCSIILPVDLVSFDVDYAENKGAELSWVTSSERNNDYFLLERSVDLSRWESISRVAAQGNSSTYAVYQVIDNYPTSGIYYYRLTQFDLDGTATDLGVRTLDLNGDVRIAPNPSAGIFMINNVTKDVELQLLNALGEPISTEFEQVSDTSWKLDLLNAASGVYFVRVNGALERIVKL